MSSTLLKQGVLNVLIQWDWQHRFSTHVSDHCHCAGVNFQYRDPERGFDRGRVKGVVAKLVRLQDPSTTTALEVAAGGKLYQVQFLKSPCHLGLMFSQRS